MLNSQMVGEILVKYQDGIADQEIQVIVDDEIQIWLSQGKELGELHLTINGEDIVVRAIEKSNITRCRRITGYLSKDTNFNASKLAELKDRRALA